MKRASIIETEMRRCRHGHERRLGEECRTCHCEALRRQRANRPRSELLGRGANHDISPLDPTWLKLVMEARGMPALRYFSVAQERAFYRALRKGRITWSRADDLACALGMHPSDIWGPLWSAA